MPTVGFIFHAVLRQRLVGELEEQRFAREPDSRLPASQSVLTVDAPVAKANVAKLVELPSETGRVEDPVQLGRIPLHALYPTKHFCRAMSTVLAIAVRPVHLVVVVRDAICTFVSTRCHDEDGWNWLVNLLRTYLMLGRNGLDAPTHWGAGISAIIVLPPESAMTKWISIG